MSLRARLFGLWLMSLFGSAVVAVLIIGLFLQTSAAHRERDRAVAARACEAVAAHYDFYTAGMTVAPERAVFDAGLRAVLALALRRDARIAGGIQAGGAAAVTVGVVPVSLNAAIGARVDDALAAGRVVVSTTGGVLRRTTVAACPLGGADGAPVADIAAFTVLRADLVRSDFTRFAFGGLAVLLATLLASAGFLARLVLGFSRRLAEVEAALGADGQAVLALTGEAELDRLIVALNAATARLDAARSRMAQSERLAALGRMAAGLAHEIRNPLGAIRLRAEGALGGDAQRGRVALERILVEAGRLEGLTSRLLGFAVTPTARVVATEVDGVIAAAIAGRDGVVAAVSGVVWPMDPVLTRGALENLIRNGIEAGGVVTVRVCAGAVLTIVVEDTGPGLDPALSDPFEPFVTGRADGIGLGLAIARDMVQAQGGTLVAVAGVTGARFELVLP